MQDQLAFFRDNGYVIVHGALSADEVATALGAETVWSRDGVNDVQLLHATSALDHVVYHPSVFPIVQHILGRDAQLCGLTYGNRPPELGLEPPADRYGEDDGDQLTLARQWHREDSGNIEGASLNSYFTPAIQCFFYLDDTCRQSHCTSVIPESAEIKATKPTTRKPLERDGRRHDGLLRIDDYGPFGAVAEEWKTPLHQASYIHGTRPTWVDAHGRECARRIGGTDICTKVLASPP